MPRRLRNRAKFLLERLLLRGTHYRLLVVIALIGIISIVGGALVHAAGGGFDSFGAAVWWAFLRLTDPGYLGDDQGALLRTVSTVLTVLGYVLFLGALIAIMTQWLNQTVRRLESGLTPIASAGHILILGWSNRTATIVRELLLSEGRVKRFLRRRRVRALRIVILADEVTAELLQELKDRLGPLYDERQIVLRSGTPLRIEHLRRVSLLDAAAIVITASDPEEGLADPDTRTIKTLLSIATQAAMHRERSLPLLVAEIRDVRVMPMVRRAYDGLLEVLVGDAIISRLIAQNVRHPGLSRVYGELLSHGRGNEIYVRDAAELAGIRFQDVEPKFGHAVTLGVVRRDGDSLRPILNPPDGLVIAAEDKLVLMARKYDDTEPADTTVAGDVARAAATSPPILDTEIRRVLVLGWSSKVPALLAEFNGYATEAFQIDVLSLIPANERSRLVQRHGKTIDRIQLRHIEGDYTASADLQPLDPGSYDTVVLIGTDRLESGQEADARTIVGYLLLRDIIGEGALPHVIVELLDPGNAALFRRRPGEVLISPLILSHMLAQVVLRNELRVVFDELFGPGGAEIFFHPPHAYGAEGKEMTFEHIQHAAAARGEIALGVRLETEPARARAGLHLNPPRMQSFTLGSADDVVVLTTYGMD
jgi:hypothetical protein